MIPYSYTALYRILGVLPPTDVAEITLVSDDINRVSAILTRDPDSRVEHLDSSSLIGSRLLGGITGQAAVGSMAETMTPLLAELRTERRRKYGAGPYLVIQAESSIADLGSEPAATRELPEFFISLGGVRAHDIRSTWEKTRALLLAAVSVAAEKPISVDLLADGTVYFPPHGKPHFVFNLELGNAHAVVSSPLREDQATEVQRLYEKLLSEESLLRVARLLSTSLLLAADRLRAFMAAWSALEILVNKVFPEYSQRVFRELSSGDHPEARATYVARIQEVMKDKYRLGDKFALVASYLAPGEANDDLEAFHELKEQRDELMHGMDVNEMELKVGVAQRLAQQYLHRHIDGRAV